jgi:hypothetical protein
VNTESSSNSKQQQQARVKSSTKNSKEVSYENLKDEHLDHVDTASTRSSGRRLADDDYGMQISEQQKKSSFNNSPVEVVSVCLFCFCFFVTLRGADECICLYVLKVMVFINIANKSV